MDDPRDRELGMKASITRRDFLNGAALVVGAAIVPDALGSILDGPALAQNAPGYYPPGAHRTPRQHRRQLPSRASAS